MSLSRFYRHVSFETLLGLAARRAPTSYWDIAGRPNPRKGKLVARRRVRRRKAVTGLRRDGFRKRTQLPLTRPPGVNQLGDVPAISRSPASK